MFLWHLKLLLHNAGYVKPIRSFRAYPYILHNGSYQQLYMGLQTFARLNLLYEQAFNFEQLHDAIGAKHMPSFLHQYVHISMTVMILKFHRHS